jgi:cell division septal protein FtsQ
MVRRYYRKPHRYKIKKPLFRRRFLAWGLLFLVVAGAIFYAVFLWKALWVEKVIVSGEGKIAKEEIERLAASQIEKKALFFDTRSILAVDTKKIREDILGAFPGIAEVEVKKSFFDAISISIRERVAVALWHDGDSNFLLDETGVIFEEAPVGASFLVIESPKPDLEMTLGQAVMTEQEISRVLDIQSKLNQVAEVSIGKAMLVSEDRLNVETTEGWEVYFNLRGDVDWQITELAQVLEKQISAAKRRVLEYVDLRFSRVYYK